MAQKQLRIPALIFLLFFQFSFYFTVGESHDLVYFYDFVFEVKKRYITLYFFFPSQTSPNIIPLLSSLISSRGP